MPGSKAARAPAEAVGLYERLLTSVEGIDVKSNLEASLRHIRTLKPKAGRPRSR
jgi:hypothetical protein